MIFVLIRYSFILVILSGMFVLNGCLMSSGRTLMQPPQELLGLKNDVHQAIIVDPLNNSVARVTTWERIDDLWRPVFKPMRSTIGKNGIAPQGEKREGDGRTPSGIYSLRTAFGYEASYPTQLDYRQATQSDFWVDDPESSQYNQWVTGIPEAKSYEVLRREDDLYRYGIVIEYNVDPIVPGHGSAIFMHLWKNPEKATAGCVAFSPVSFRKILGWLNKDAQPVIILNYPGRKNLSAIK